MRAGLGPCSVAGCDGNDRNAGMCALHYRRLRYGKEKDPHLPKYGDARRPVTYAHAHDRVKRLWGSANSYPCAMCPRQARDWAYDGADPTEMLGYRDVSKRSGKSWYSLYPEFYLPLCRSCHLGVDGKRKADELQEYREWKYRFRAQLPDLTSTSVGPDGD